MYCTLGDSEAYDRFDGDVRPWTPNLVFEGCLWNAAGKFAIEWLFLLWLGVPTNIGDFGPCKFLSVAKMVSTLRFFDVRYLLLTPECADLQVFILVTFLVSFSSVGWFSTEPSTKFSAAPEGISMVFFESLIVLN